MSLFEKLLISNRHLIKVIVIPLP